jgi:hypothetical protein
MKELGRYKELGEELGLNDARWEQIKGMLDRKYNADREESNRIFGSYAEMVQEIVTIDLPDYRPAAKPWLIFGTDGKDEAALRTAVNTGYRRFDTAEAYGNIELVSNVLQNQDPEWATWRACRKSPILM